MTGAQTRIRFRLVFMRVAVYTRVSTEDQNTELQRVEVLAYCHRAGWTEVEVYRDVASGANTKRPELERMMGDVRQRRVNCVCVWALDRLGRSLADCLSLLDVFKRYGVRFVCISQPIDLNGNNPAGELVVSILGAAAQFERAMILERSAAGRRRYDADLAAGRVGKTVHSKSGKNLAPHRPRKVFDRERVAQLRAAGWSLPKIAKEMGLGLGTVARCLSKSGGQKTGSVVVNSGDLTGDGQAIQK